MLKLSICSPPVPEVHVDPLRCLYMLIPAVTWVVAGTVPFLGTACVMMVLLAYLDRPLRKARPLEYFL